MAVDKKISQLASGAPAQAGDEYVVARSGANYKLTLTNIAASMPPIGATTPNTGSFTSLTNSGNLTFSSTGQRITGDFSNATQSNRLAFQTSTTNGATDIYAIPNGTGSTGAFTAVNASDPNNASTAILGAFSDSVRLYSNRNGTGTFYPMTFYTGGSERMRLDTSGNLGIGTASPGGKLDVRDTNCIVYSRGTGGFGAFYATGSGTNPSYLFMGNATSGEQGRITCENGGAIAFGNTASATERMRIDSSGNVGIGGTAVGNARCQILGTMPVLGGNTNSQSFFQNASVPSSITGTARGFSSTATTDASSFTLTKFVGFQANQGTIGSGSTVTTQVGFEAASTLTGATNNYGFYSDIASGSNRWNFYAAGTARNYFAGNIGVGADSAVVRVFARGANTASTDYVYYGENSAATLLFYVRNDGIFNTGVAANSPYNLTTANAANCFINSDGALYRSTSSLRYKTDVANAAHGLADVLKLRSVTYKAKNDGDKVFGGLIAEEVHDAGLTEFVAYDKEGRPDALHYGNMVALLIKAVQELKAELDALKAV